MTLDGPFPVFARDVAGELTDVLAPGEHYKTEPATYAAFAELLEPYRVHPAQLQNVWAGDDPAQPVETIALRFPDVETAEAVRLAILGPPADA